MVQELDEIGQLEGLEELKVPDWDCLKAIHMSSSSKTDNLMCSFETLDNV
jgi:hypothetical protein